MVCGMQAKQEQISLAEQRGKEAEDRLAGVTLEHAKAQQQLQEFQGTIRDLTAQLQEADTAVADKPKVSCAYTCCQGLLLVPESRQKSWCELACSCSATTGTLLAVSLFNALSDCRRLREQAMLLACTFQAANVCVV